MVISSVELECCRRRAITMLSRLQQRVKRRTGVRQVAYGLGTRSVALTMALPLIA